MTAEGGKAMAYVSVNIDVDDVLDELDTSELKRALRDRGEDEGTITDTERDCVEQAHHALLRRDLAEAALYIERALFGRQKLFVKNWSTSDKVGEGR